MEANGQHEAGEPPKDRKDHDDTLPVIPYPEDQPLGPLERHVNPQGVVYWPKPDWFVPAERLLDSNKKYPNALRCKKWCARKGRQCRLPVGHNYLDMMLCDRHGKSVNRWSPRGPAHHNWKTGEYSKHMRPSVRDFYHSSLYDPNALSLLTEIGLAEARAFELYESLPSEGGLGVWDEAKKAWGEVKKAQRANDPTKLGEAMRHLEKTITKGVDCEQTHTKLRKAWDAKARLVAVEVASKQVKNNYMPREAVVQLLSMVWAHGVDAIRESLSEAFVASGDGAVEVAKKLEGAILKAWASKVGPLFPASKVTPPALPGPAAAVVPRPGKNGANGAVDHE